MSKIPLSKLKTLRKLYYAQHYTMSEVARHLDVSLDSVIYFMRHHDLKRRNLSEASAVAFTKKKPSFVKKTLKSFEDKELAAIGAMLYWGEGYKGDKASGIDFANSDPEMISMFLKFLRNTYEIDEKRLRVFMYCYANQNLEEIKQFWVRLTKIPIDQFTKPYIRKDFRLYGRKMRYGLIHIRYSDKKLLLEVKKLIEYYQHKFCVGTQVVNEDAL